MNDIQTKYIKMKLFNNGIVEKEQIEEQDARGWINNPGWCSDGYTFVIDTSDKVEKAFKRHVEKEIKILKERMKKEEEKINNFEKVLQNINI